MDQGKYPQVLWFGQITYSEHQISMIYGLDRMRFTCSYWLSEINLFQLESKISKSALEKILFNIMCFEANKLCSMKPKILDLGIYAKYWTKRLEQVWKQVVFRVWGQWRYNHNFPNYRGPQVRQGTKIEVCQGSPLEIKQGNVANFCFFGGGKDSLASTTLLDNIGLDYEILTYTNSIYGEVTKQINIIHGLMDKAVKKKYYYTYVYDDFVNCPIIQVENYNIKELLAAQTPSSVFFSLLYALYNGYTSIILGHQRSADKGNLIWNNEDINHQWGKSTEAQKILRDYIQQQLITNINYYSILKPLYDTGIVLITSTREEFIHLTHSCNIDKPWCKKCPKCCYVWLLYQAYMDQKRINEMFNNCNLLDMKQNHHHFRELLGLEQHTPFQCVGRPEQVRICFELLRLRGVKGLAMTDFLNIQVHDDYVNSFEEFSSINQDYQAIPENIREKYYSQLKRIINSKKPLIIERLEKGKNIPRK